MKGIIQHSSDYFKFFIIILSLFFFSSCDGITPAAPVIHSFTADSTTIDEGESVNLSWSVTDAASVSVSPSIGSVALSGSTSVSPSDTTTYTLTATNSAGSSTATVTITVHAAIVEQTLTIQPGPEGKDNYTFDNVPTMNYNLENYLLAGISSIDSKWRSYLQFDLSVLPTNAVITDAKLGLFYYYQSGTNNLDWALYKVQEPWQEDTINWINQPACSNIAEFTLLIPDSPVNDFVYWQIKDLVRGWHEGSISNYGMMLRDNDESNNNGATRFWSSDYSMESQRPKLVIDYYIP